MRFLADENFNNDILRALKRHYSQLDITRVQDTPMMRMTDSELLASLAETDIILLSHDVNTMTKYFYERVNKGESLPTIMLLHQERPLSESIEALEMVIEASHFEEWRGQLRFLPL
ncbi:MAG: DUF5615 family PIN-like protein [bacterium]|nr:DUF5615 family PIN-like protein [bacterium]